MILRSTLLTLIFSYTFALLFSSSTARPYKDSPIQTIIVPYQSKVLSGHPYHFPKAVGESRHVLVPVTMNMLPSFNLDHNAMSMSSASGMLLNFADGAYPVYYMPGNANGKFNGKISLLS